MTRTITPDLVVLARAFLGGDDSAIYPLTDCLLENGWPEHCQQLWFMWDVCDKTRSSYIDHFVCLSDEGKMEHLTHWADYLRDYWSKDYPKELEKRFPIPNESTAVGGQKVTVED